MVLLPFFDLITPRALIDLNCWRGDVVHVDDGSESGPPTDKDIATKPYDY